MTAEIERQLFHHSQSRSAIPQQSYAITQHNSGNPCFLLYKPTVSAEPAFLVACNGIHPDFVSPFWLRLLPNRRNCDKTRSRGTNRRLHSELADLRMVITRPNCGASDSTLHALPYAAALRNFQVSLHVGKHGYPRIL